MSDEEERDYDEEFHDLMLDISILMQERGLSLHEQKKVLEIKLYYLNLAEDDVCGDSI